MTHSFDRLARSVKTCAEPLDSQASDRQAIDWSPLVQMSDAIDGGIDALEALADAAHSLMLSEVRRACDGVAARAVSRAANQIKRQERARSLIPPPLRPGHFRSLAR